MVIVLVFIFIIAQFLVTSAINCVSVYTVLCLNDDYLTDSRLLCFSIIIMTNLYYALYYDDVVVHFDSY